MVRKRDRVISTLLVWIAVVMAMAMIIGRLNWAAIEMRNFWYYSGNVVTGASQEEATQILQDINIFTGELSSQAQQIAQAELFVYLPYVLLIGAVLLIGGVLSTMFIWRSVIVPAEVSEAIAEKNAANQIAPRSIETLLDDDGELLNPETDTPPLQNHR